MTTRTDVELLERSFREDRAVVVAAVARRTGDLQLAEDAAQDAFAAAAARWPVAGVPDSPRAWLVATGWRKAVDRLRRRRSQQDRASRLDVAAPAAPDPDAAALDDDVLGLVLACCHPALSHDSRVALTLRCVLGLTTRRVARVLLVREATLAQRLVRAKRKIRDAGLSLAVPPPREVAGRLAAVRDVVALLFTAGSVAPDADDVVDVELCDEAIWLARLLHRLAPRDAETGAVLALLLLVHARTPARADPAGRPVLLGDQDRDRWDAAMIAEGLDLLRTTRQGQLPGPFWIEAAIAGEHARSASLAATDWPRIAALYRALAVLRPDPVITVNRAVAVGRADGPAAGLALLRPVLASGELEDLPALHAAHADLLEQAGRPAEAAAAWARATDCSTSAAHRRLLAQRTARLAP